MFENKNKNQDGYYLKKKERKKKTYARISPMQSVFAPFQNLYLSLLLKSTYMFHKQYEMGYYSNN